MIEKDNWLIKYFVSTRLALGGVFSKRYGTDIYKLLGGLKPPSPPLPTGLIYLTSLLPGTRIPGYFHCLNTSLARILATKPHSGDVELLIIIYKLKSSGRASLSPGTIKYYLHVSQNMGDLHKEPLIGLEEKPEGKGCQ